MDHLLSVALKEWAIVVEAILEGRQTLLVRPGSAREVHQEFRVEHGEFLLYPIYEEQKAEHVLPAWRPRFERVASRRPASGEVVLKAFCSVEAIWEVRDPAGLAAPPERVIWTAEYLRREYPEGQPACALLVRAFRLPETREISVLARYAAARSWLDLADQISVEGARPVLTDEAYRRQASELHKQLA
jgi:hypothetical protein